MEVREGLYGWIFNMDKYKVEVCYNGDKYWYLNDMSVGTSRSKIDSNSNDKLKVRVYKNGAVYWYHDGNVIKAKNAMAMTCERAFMLWAERGLERKSSWKSVKINTGISTEGL